VPVHALLGLKVVVVPGAAVLGPACSPGPCGLWPLVLLTHAT